MGNTRFNPTCNGPLHLGHIYMILVNEYEAHRSSGKFIMRFDDNQPYWINRIGHKAMTQYTEEMRRDLDWLEIPVDEWTYQSKLQAETDHEILWRNKGPLPVRQQEEGSPLIFNLALNCSIYPYLPWLTAEKVLQDWHDLIRPLIRGEDLMSEAALYSYFCEIWNVPSITQYYLGRLTHKDSELTSISKTEGDLKVSYFRSKGIKPKAIIETLENWCLINPNGSWTLDNLIQHPTVGKFLW